MIPNNSTLTAEAAKKVVESVITGEDFKMPSDSAKLAVQTASQLMTWITESDTKWECSPALSVASQTSLNSALWPGKA